jgi:hypothetical protein
MRSDFATMLAIARDGPDALESPGRSLTLPYPSRERPRPDLRAIFRKFVGPCINEGCVRVRLSAAATAMGYSRAPRVATGRRRVDALGGHGACVWPIHIWSGETKRARLAE